MSVYELIHNYSDKSDDVNNEESFVYERLCCSRSKKKAFLFVMKSILFIIFLVIFLLLYIFVNNISTDKPNIIYL